MKPSYCYRAISRYYQWAFPYDPYTVTDMRIREVFDVGGTLNYRSNPVRRKVAVFKRSYR